MSTSVRETETTHFVIHFSPVLSKISDDDFFQFCQLNSDWRIESTSSGDVIFMPLTGGETGSRNFELTGAFGQWANADKTGKGFDSSTGFALPNGAKRSPDLAWVRLSRWNSLTDEERRQFPPICPDFVVELRSDSDSLPNLQAKMKEYIDNGAQLGWLIDPTQRKVYVYRPHSEVQQLDDPETVSGEPLLTGFALKVQELWR